MNILAVRKRSLAPSSIKSFKGENYLHHLSHDVLNDILKTSEGRLLTRILGSLKDQKTLFLTVDDRVYAHQIIKDENPKSLIHVQLKSCSKKIETPQVIAEGKKLPLKKNYFDQAIACLSEVNFDSIEMINALSSALKPGGTLLLSVLHPTLDLLLKNQNPLSKENIKIQLQDYIQESRIHSLYLENMIEATVQNDLKSFLTFSKEDPCFEEYIGIPLVVCFRFVKYISHE